MWDPFPFDFVELHSNAALNSSHLVTCWRAKLVQPQIGRIEIRDA